MESFGQRVKQFAKAKYGGQKGLAAAAGIEYTQLSKYVSDKIQPGGEALQKLASAGLSLEWALSGRGQMDGRGSTPEDIRAARSVELRRLAARLQELSGELIKLADE